MFIGLFAFPHLSQLVSLSFSTTSYACFAPLYYYPLPSAGCLSPSSQSPFETRWTVGVTMGLCCATYRRRTGIWQLETGCSMGGNWYRSLGYCTLVAGFTAFPIQQQWVAIPLGSIQVPYPPTLTPILDRRQIMVDGLPIHLPVLAPSPPGPIVAPYTLGCLSDA